MSYSPIAIKRSQVLGNIYKNCDTVQRIPVYLNDELGELLGYADESMGPYADAFLFHLSEEVCKKLSTGHYNFGIDYDVLDDRADKKRHFKLNFIVLVGKITKTAKAQSTVPERPADMTENG